MAERSRRKLLVELRDGPKTVGTLVKRSGLRQSNVSNHLAKLRSRGIVAANRIGREVVYSLSCPAVEEALDRLVDEEETPACAFDLAAAPTSYVDAAIAGDEIECARIVDRALRSGMNLEDVYQNVLAEAMHQVGERYEAGRIDVGQEHLASAITERLMGRLIQHAPHPKADAPRALLGCVENNWHTIGLRMVADLLKLRGWRTFYLGASVPEDSMIAALREHDPDLVLLNCTCEESREACLDVVRTLVTTRPPSAGFRIGVGGLAVNHDPEPFLKAGADFTAIDLKDFGVKVLDEAPA